MKERPLYLSEQELRKMDLEQKYDQGTLTEEERAELYGLRAFPKNPRGAELEKKIDIRQHL